MAAILNGFLPLRRKDQNNDNRVLNARWGDAAITAPMHGGWNTQDNASDHSQTSPDLDRDLPPTPPQDHFDGQDGVFIVEDDDGTDGGAEKDSITVTIPLPWKKKKASSHIRKSSYQPSVLNLRFAAPKRMDLMAPLGTSDAAAIPLPESRVSSPIGRAATTSPVLTFSPAMSFRSRLASPSLRDILSPVAEGFAKEGPSHRATPVLSPLQFAQSIEADRPSSSTSMRSTSSRRPSINGHMAEGLMGSTMSSQALATEQNPEYVRPASRGIGSTACMRASSRGPRASSRGPRAPSVEPFARRAPSVEPLDRRAPSVEPIGRRVPSVEPFNRRAPSVEPIGCRAPSIEPIHRRRDPSVDSSMRFRQPLDESILHRREPSIEPSDRRREPSVEPHDRRRNPSPIRRRAPSAEPTSRRAPSFGPRADRRAVSREPRGRRGMSVEPMRVRFRSEAPYRHKRGDSDSSANDASADSESETEAQTGRETHFNRFEKQSGSFSRSYRRRSIASPVTSPVHATFDTAETGRNSYQPVSDVIDTRMAMSAGSGLTRPLSPPQPLSMSGAPRARSISRTRGLYADMHDDFRLLGRDVHIATAVPSQSPVPERIPSPINFHQPVGIAATLEQSRVLDHSSDTSTPINHYRPTSAFERERPDRGRDEREKARENLARKLEKEREFLSGDESVMSGTESTMRRGYSGTDVKLPSKVLVPDAEEIWG